MVDLRELSQLPFRPGGGRTCARGARWMGSAGGEARAPRGGQCLGIGGQWDVKGFGYLCHRLICLDTAGVQFPFSTTSLLRVQTCLGWGLNGSQEVPQDLSQGAE